MKNKATETLKGFKAWRYDLRRHTWHYVSSLPCKDYPTAPHKGDFGYSTDHSKAITLSLWWLRRWESQMRFCGRKPSDFGHTTMINAPDEG